MSVADLPSLNAALNGLATVLLVTGYWLIRRGRVTAHRNMMLAALGTSAAFLVSYVVYHFRTEAVTQFAGPERFKIAYLVILGSHVVLAMLVPPLALRTAWLGLRGRVAPHRRLARWTFPIWLYVSITGVLIYVVLYVAFPAHPR